MAVLAMIASAPPAVAAQVGDAAPLRPERAQRDAQEADDIALLLALRPAQRPALTAFLQSMAPPPPRFPPVPQGPRSDDAGPAGDGFARQLDRMTQDIARRSAEDTRRIAVARTFYDGLDPAQRRAFEALMRLRHGAGPGERGPSERGPSERGPSERGPGERGPGPHHPMDQGGPPQPDRMPPPR